MSETECIIKLMKQQDAAMNAINATDFKMDKALAWIDNHIQPLHREFAEHGYSATWAAKVKALEFSKD